MKKLLIKLSIIFIPLGFLIITTNLIVDPANIFSGEKYVKNIASILISGNNADNISNYNERLLQKQMLLMQKQKMQVIVMGSSRIMEVNSAIFPNKKLLNIGVSHANVNDLIALTGMLDTLQLLPQEVIIGVDPFLICKGDKGVSEWQSLKEFHTFFVKKNCNVKTDIIDEEDNVYKKYYTMITFEYFKTSLEFLIKKHNKNVVNIGNETPKMGGRFSDGSVAYNNLYKHPDTMLVANVAKSMGQKNAIPEIDENKQQLFECLIQYFKKNNIKVTFLMFPFHKNYYEEISKKQTNIFDSYELFYKKLASQNNISILGSFSPMRFNSLNSDFYDTYHISGEAISKFFKNNN